MCVSEKYQLSLNTILYPIAVLEFWTSSDLCLGASRVGGGGSGKESTCQCRRCKKLRFNPWIGKIPWRRQWQSTAIFLPGKAHRQRVLASYISGVCRHNWAHNHWWSLYFSETLTYLRKYVILCGQFYLHGSYFTWKGNVRFDPNFSWSDKCRIRTLEGMQVSLNLLARFALGDSLVPNFLVVGQGDICANYDTLLYLAFLVAQMVKNPPATWETRVWSLGQKDSLAGGMDTHSSIPDWRNPWTEEPGGLQSMKSQRVRHDWATNTLFRLIPWTRQKALTIRLSLVDSES